MKRVCAVLLTVILVLASAGCKKEEKMNDAVTLTWWVPLFQHVGKTSASFSDNELYKELMKRTGVNIEFIHPRGGENFEVLLMSDNLPDLIEYSFQNYKGGPQRAIDDGVIIGIDSFMEEYSPNYTKVLRENPQWDKEVVTDKGSHYTYAWIRGDESLLYWKGLQIRSDLLEKAGLSVPVTIDEWDRVLSVFKSMGIKYPLTYRWAFNNDDPFASAFNVTSGYYQLDGIVKFSPFENGYKEYLQLLNKWYADGILDPEFLSQNDALLESKVSQGHVGAYFGTLGGNMGNSISSLKEIGAGVTATQIPVKNYGDKVFQSMRDTFYQSSTSVSISSNCENVEAAAKLLDYGYGEEGHFLYNFGIEGISYKMSDGYPKYLPEITDNPHGLSMQHAMSKYMASAYGGPFIQDKREYEQYLRYPEQKQAMQLWSEETADHKLPRGLLIPTEIENTERQINNYCSRTILKFITGEIPFSQYDGFVESIRQMGAEEVIAAKQNSLDKYTK